MDEKIRKEIDKFTVAYSISINFTHFLDVKTSSVASIEKMKILEMKYNQQSSNIV